VEAENGTTLTLLGFPINIAGATDGFSNLDGTPISLDAFLNAVTPATNNAAGVSVAGTLVKVTFNNGATTVKEVELED
jgi:expansin (peptidoglycan-binding protein)